MGTEQVVAFDSPDFGRLRVLVQDGEVWFLAKDVCAFLGTRTDNLRVILDEDEVRTIRPVDVGESAGGRDMLLVSEGGFYSMVLRARKIKDDPERTGKVTRFRRWVTHDVLPSVRKTSANREYLAEIERKLVVLREYVTRDCHLEGEEIESALETARRNLLLIGTKFCTGE